MTCAGCLEAIPYQSCEPPFIEDTCHTSVFVDGREFMYHWRCYVARWDKKQRASR